MTFTDFGPIGPALALLAVAGMVVSYLLLRREMQSELQKLRELVEQRSERTPQVVAPPAPEPKLQSAPIAAPAAKTAAPPKPVPAATPPPAPAHEELTQEILAVIAAAVAQFVGAGARIRSTRLLAAPAGASPWAQQGRVIIQASHNLGAR